MFDLLCFGELVWDCYPTKKYLGGAPVNVASIAKLLDLRTGLISAVGRDKLGMRAEEILKKRKIRAFLQKNKRATGKVQITLNKKKIPRFTLATSTAYDHIRYTKEIEKVMKKAKLLYFGTLIERSLLSRKTLERLLAKINVTTIYDVNVRKTTMDWKHAIKRLLSFASIVKMNEKEIELVRTEHHSSISKKNFPDFLLVHYDIQKLFITYGSQGAEVYTSKKHLYMKARKIDVVDTVGCGDAFVASLAYSTHHKHALKKTLQHAITTAGKIAMVEGAVPENLHRL